MTWVLFLLLLVLLFWIAAALSSIAMRLDAIRRGAAVTELESIDRRLRRVVEAIRANGDETAQAAIPLQRHLPHLNRIASALERLADAPPTDRRAVSFALIGPPTSKEA